MPAEDPASISDIAMINLDQLISLLDNLKQWIRHGACTAIQAWQDGFIINKLASKSLLVLSAVF